MNILLVGLNHQTAPVEIREKLALDSCAPPETYYNLKSIPYFSEQLFLSTCNRVEVLVICDDPEPAAEEIKAFLGSRHGVAPSEFEDCLYVLKNEEAVTHMFKVASSLDSMVVGEPQILGQLKDSYRAAVDNQATGAILNKLLHKSFSVAKRVRTETGISSHAVSIGYAAVELARKIFGDLKGRTVLLIGAGEMAELTAEHLLGNGASRITVANRTLKRAVDLAQRWDGRAVSLEELPAVLHEVDIVISSTGSPETVVRAETVKAGLKARKHRPLFFVDIAVPRDVDPAVNRLSNVYLYDIDDLKSVVEENRAARSEEAVRAERIVAEETLAFKAWLQVLGAFPTITALKDKAETIRRAELKKTMNRLGPLSPEQHEAIEIMTQALVRKLLHDPILFIKSAGRHSDERRLLGMARRVLGLDETDDNSAEEAVSEEESGKPNTNRTAAK